MNDESTSARLDAAERVMAEAIERMRRAVATASSGSVLVLLEDAESFFALLEATETLLRIARTEPMSPRGARETADAAYRLAVASADHASARLRQLQAHLARVPQPPRARRTCATATVHA